MVLASLCAALSYAADPDAADAFADEQELEVSESVAVEPTAADPDIAARLTRILRASGWFEQPQVRVEEGIVFLGGRSATEEHKDWATRVARNTQDVLAVVNRIEVVERSMWDLSPTWARLRQLARESVRNIPLILLGVLMLAATWIVAKWSARGALGFLRRRIASGLLADVVARAIALPVFILGLYVVLSISGLTGLALSVLGGTGLVGLIIGFAFRDIAENFLASLLISMQRPFATGDLIAVAGHTGIVQRVNTRATLLMTLEGNHVQIPNATIYKETITNYTANPHQRFDFTVGIGYEDSVAQAQTLAQSVLRDHEAVLDEPEPLVLAESLGAATVNLRIYFWVNIATHSGLKVRSSVIRLTKRAFDRAGISMPDEAREVVFPEGLPVHMLSGEEKEEPKRRPSLATADDSSAHSAEGHLTSDTREIEQQARNARVPEGGQNLLES
jgi:small-conductance mechanosensitive channel